MNSDLIAMSIGFVGILLAFYVGNKAIEKTADDSDKDGKFILILLVFLFIVCSTACYMMFN